MKKAIRMEFERSTKRTFRFKADESEAVDTLYVKKELFDGKEPKTITVL